MKTLFVLATALILSTGLFARPWGGYYHREFRRPVVHVGFGFGPRIVARPFYGGYGYYHGGRCERGYYYHGRCGRRW